jgi:UPF0271 protein
MSYFNLNADRAYMSDGQLASRSRPDSMIHDPQKSLKQCLRMFLDGEVITVEGTTIKLKTQSVCVHGDGPTVLATAHFVKDGLIKAVLKNASLPEIVVD